MVYYRCKNTGNRMLLINCGKGKSFGPAVQMQVREPLSQITIPGGHFLALTPDCNFLLTWTLGGSARWVLATHAGPLLEFQGLGFNLPAVPRIWTVNQREGVFSYSLLLCLPFKYIYIYFSIYYSGTLDTMQQLGKIKFWCFTAQQAD